MTCFRHDDTVVRDTIIRDIPRGHVSFVVIAASTHDRRQSMIHRYPLFSVIAIVLAAGSIPSARGQDIVGMVKRVKPAVVTVVPENAFGLDEGLGSGFFIDRTRVVTNYHVIDGASAVRIKLNDSTKLHAKHIVAQDSALDLAILEIDVPKEWKVAPLPLLIQDPEQGQRIYVVGNPLGLEQSISDGIVSSVRIVKDQGKQIQFTAAISPGNSGSPLLDANGKVYGVAHTIMQGGQNLNFAIPSEKIGTLKIGEPIAFQPSVKVYEGIRMRVIDAFVVDTTLIGNPPSDLAPRDRNIWRLRTAALRARWKAEVVDKNMSRLVRAVKRNYTDFDIDGDSLTMSQAHAIISEALGRNDADDDYPPEIASRIEGMKLDLKAAMAQMYLSNQTVPLGFTAGIISGTGQMWQELQKDRRYVVVTASDTTAIADIDMAVFRYEDGMWKAVAANTKDDAFPYVYFTAPDAGEYAIVWRVAEYTGIAKEGVVGTFIVTTE